MFKRLVFAALAAAATIGVAFAHGGGGGGGHGGGFVVVGGFGGAVPIPLPEPIVGNYANIHTIAIISGIGQTFTINRHIGVMNDGRKDIDITNWKLDERATADVARWLGTRFAIKNVSYDAAALAKIPNGHLDTSPAELEAFLKTVPHDGVDAFVVLRPDIEKNRSEIQGMGSTNGNYVGGAAQPVIVWANYEIDIVDANTLKEVGKSYARAQSRAGAGPTFASYVVPTDLDPGDGMTYTPLQTIELRAQFAYMIDNTVLETLRSLQLGVPLPMPGARELVDIPLRLNPYARFKNVAIVSVLGDQLDLSHAGATVFSNATNTVRTPDWNIDMDIEDMIRASIDKHFVVKDVGFARSALGQESITDGRGNWKQTVDGLPNVPDVDAFIVVMKRSRPFPGFKGYIDGLGIWNYSAFIERTEVFASYDLAIVDARTFKIIAARIGTMGPQSASAFPLSQVDDGLWPTDPANVTSQQQSEVRTRIGSLMQDSIPETLLLLLLTGKMVKEPTDVSDTTVNIQIPTSVGSTEPDYAPTVSTTPAPSSPPN